jgi:ABC-type ATPase involved in cell division
MYQEWYKSFKNILWINGHPGTGKSIMMKKILEMAKPDKA